MQTFTPPDARPSFTVVDAIAQILRIEGVEFLSAYPTTPLIDAAVRAGIKPVLCRQERVGVGIADGYTRVSRDGRFGVFACQFGPGIENAFAGIASAYSDGIPILVLPMANALTRAQISPLFRAERSFASITKSFETILRPDSVAAVMARAVTALRNGVPGPVIVEVPVDIGAADVSPDLDYRPVTSARSAAEPAAVARALEELLAARAPVILAGHGILQSGATPELVALAELLRIPVLTTIAGKSSIPERHPLAAGVVGMTASDPAVEQLRGADVVFAAGTSLTRHFLSPKPPTDATLIHLSVNPGDFNKGYRADHCLLGDARLVLAQFLDAAQGRPAVHGDEIEARISQGKRAWREKWAPKLTSDEVPITPYRAIHELMAIADPDELIVTHDSGSPRDQIAPFYESGGPRSYLGWGKSHALGGGLGLAIGAKLGAPDKICVHVQGDAAFGMTGLDIETAARCGLPIISLVFNNSTMAIETETLVESHELFATRDIGGDYTRLADSLGVAARRVEQPEALRDALQWGIDANRAGQSVLIEVITSVETDFSNRFSVNH
jgi:acetolactate synthase-1/2/3 large subunit